MRRLATGLAAAAALLAGASGCAPSEPTIDLDSAELDLMEPQVARLLRAAHAEVVADPRSMAAWSELAMALDAHGLWSEAATCYEIAHELDPGAFEPLYLWALARVETGPAQESVELLRRAAALDGSHPSLYVRLGGVLEGMSRAREAREAYERALLLDPTRLDAHLGLGQVLLALELQAEAVPHLERAHRAEPTDQRAAVTLARAYRLVGRDDEARRLADASAGLGGVIGHRDPVRAKVNARAIDMRSCVQRAKRLLLAGDHTGAIGNLEVVLAVEPDNAWAHAQIARAYWETWQPRPGAFGGAQDELAKAGVHFERALALDRDLADAHYGLARVRIVQQRKDDAIEGLSAAVERRPDFRAARLLLAGLLVDAGRDDEGVRHFERAGEDPASPTGASRLDVKSHVSWAEALTRLGRPVQAMRQLEVAVEVNPRDARAHYHLALAYVAVGRRKEAVDAYETARGLQPSHPLAARVAEALR